MARKARIRDPDVSPRGGHKKRPIKIIGREVLLYKNTIYGEFRKSAIILDGKIYYKRGVGMMVNGKNEHAAVLRNYLMDHNINLIGDNDNVVEMPYDAEEVNS